MEMELVWLFLIICVGFGVGMAAITTFIEYYAEYVKRYNNYVNKHSAWLSRTGMRESYQLIVQRYKQKF